MRMALTDEMEKYQINLSLYRMIQVKADNDGDKILSCCGIKITSILQPNV